MVLIPDIKRKRMVLESYCATSYQNPDSDYEMQYGRLERQELVREPMKEAATLL